MSKNTKKLVPKLRFPEFRDSGEWGETRLNKLGELVSGLTYSPEDVRDAGLLVLRSSNVQNGEITLDDNVYVRSDIKGANLSKPNDILICVRNGSKALIGKNAMIPEGMPLCTHGAFMTVFRATAAKFVFQLFQSAAYQKQVDADLGATINSINGSQFLKYKFFVPLPKEQQKIADCLSSIDDLINAQSQKVEALKTHKKGLMQQLFPREGETVPRLRFPEFRDAGGWQEKKLLSIIQLISGLHLSPNQYSNKGAVPYFTGPSDFTNRIQSISKWTQESTSVASENDILITVKGSGVGEVWYLTLPLVSMGRQLMAVRAIKSSSRFIYQYLLTRRSRFEDLASGNLIPGLSRGDILDMEGYFPSVPEQHKIANCLSSIDDLISAQLKKLEYLKKHKKGLMQQLFPNMETDSE